MITANISTPPSTNPPNSYSLFITVRIFLSGALILVTLIANIFLLYVLWIVKKVRVIKNDGCGYYVINLCVIDVLASLICIMCTALYRFTESCDQFTVFWKIFSSVQILFSSGWIATVAVMIMERLGVTKNPLLKRATFRRMKIRLMLAWCWAICNSSPQLFLRQYITVDIHVRCDDHSSHEKSNKFVFPVIRMVSIFVIPSILILFSTLGVLTHHFTSENALSLKRKKGHQRLAYLVFVLWITFLVSNFPKHVLELAYGVYNRNSLLSHEQGYRREQTFMYILVVSWSIYLITPVVYFVLYKRILKHELKKSGAKWIYMICFRGKSKASNSQRNRSKAPCKSTMKSTEDFDVDSSEYRYLLQNLGVLEPGTSVRSVTKEESTNISSVNEIDNKDGTLTARIRKISQPLLKKKSTANSLEHNVDPYLLPSNEHTLHTLNQRTPLLERQERVGTPPKRKMTLPLI